MTTVFDNILTYVAGWIINYKEAYMSVNNNGIENMSDAELRAEIKHLVKSTDKIASNMATLTEFMIRSEENRTRQNEINQHVQMTLDTHSEEIQTIKLERAREEQSRNFIMKYWPWLLVVAVVVVGAVSYLPKLAM
jgi:hypothetical protein